MTREELAKLEQQAVRVLDQLKKGELTNCPCCAAPLKADPDMRGFTVSCACGWSMAASGYDKLAPGVKAN